MSDSVSGTPKPTDAPTRLVRTKGGAMVHRRGCHYAGFGKPWFFAEGKTDDEVTAALAIPGLGVHLCKACKPLGSGAGR